MSVRRIPPSLVISVAVHVALAGAWTLADFGEDPRDERRASTSPVIELADPEPPPETEVEIEAEPVAFAMLDAAALERIPALATAEPPKAKAAATPQRERIAARAVEPPTTTQVTPPKSELMDMRKGRDLEGRGRDALSLATANLEGIVAPKERERSVIETDNPSHSIVGAKPTESVVTAKITPGGRGGYKVDDLVFKGRIEADGSVSIRDKRNVQHQFTSWKNVKKVLRESGPFGLTKLDFDVTDALMRKKKIDPYASRKLAFLDQTRDARVEIGKEYRKQVLARTSEIVRGNLDWMWTTITDEAKRKQALFDMWDEVEESGDEHMIQAGIAARAQIVGFIRAKFPRDGGHGFTTAEVTALNAKRKSRRPFAPYE